MRNKKIGFLIGWVFLFLISLVSAFIWLMSPLGIGFNANPNIPESTISLGEKLYAVSYFLGIPSLIITQIIAGVMGYKGCIKTAVVLSVLSIIIFMSLAALSLMMLT